MNHFVSATCTGEKCRCGKPATHKVEEVIPFDDPVFIRHPRGAYTCCTCFTILFGASTACPFLKGALDA